MTKNQVTKFKDRPVLITINLITLFISIIFFLFVPVFQIYKFFFDFIFIIDFKIVMNLFTEGLSSGLLDRITDRFGHPLYIAIRLIGGLLVYFWIFILGVRVWYNLIKYIFNKNRRNIFDYNLVILENPIVNIGQLLYFVAFFVLLFVLVIADDNFRLF